jgi:hypothetical protein
MANQVVPRLTGDDYQHLYGWWKALLLLKDSERVSHVRIEDPDAGSVDDVTVYRHSQGRLPDEFFHYFFQVKYHANHSQQYGIDNLLEHKPNGTSLLQKFHRTWKDLRTSRPQEPVLLHLVSNWSWNGGNDDLGSFVSGTDDQLTREFFAAALRTQAGKLRERLREHLGIDEEELTMFLRSIKFELGAGCWKSIRDRVSERMEHFDLKHDEAALVTCSGLVRNWIIERRGDITRTAFERLLRENHLYEEKAANSGTSIHLTTIQARAFPLMPDYVLDWREYFEGAPNRKGHRIRRQEDWDEKLLPGLLQIEAEVAHRESRLIRARGFARLSAWFGFGYVFSRVAGYTIEVQQNEDRFWRSDDQSSTGFYMEVQNEVQLIEHAVGRGGERLVACGISVTGDLKEDVLQDLQYRENVEAAIFLRPAAGLGMNAFQSAGDVVSFVDQTKLLLREFVKRHGANELLLYYFGPLSGACFLGQQLNAICRSIVIMEDQQPGYAPAFHLKF